VVLDARRLASEVLQQIEIGLAIFVETNQLAIDNGAGGQIGQRFDNVRKLSIQGFSSPRIERHTGAGFHHLYAITIQFDFFCGVRRYVALGNRFWLARHIDGPRRHIISYQRLRRNCISTASFFQCFARTAPRISHVASALAFISRSTSA
jgi:hypothetical protein